jgi:hypothetical protein
VSRYLILLLINTPFIVAGVLNALVNFKLKKVSTRRFIYQLGMWLLVFASLALIKPIYEFLFSNNLTKTEPLSLFDVMQITGIVAVVFISSRSRAKIEVLERRVQDLHQELSIRLADTKDK